eukprot:scaffold5684_cov169-Amphora_coffeaeformis.AAC.5
MPIVIGKQRPEEETAPDNKTASAAKYEVLEIHEVEVRKTKVIKNEYTWERPEWATKVPFRSKSTSPPSSGNMPDEKIVAAIEDEQPEFAKKALFIRSSGHAA